MWTECTELVLLCEILDCVSMAFSWNQGAKFFELLAHET